MRADVAEHLVQLNRYLEPRHADVLVGAARLTGPLPRLIEHPSVDGVNEWLIERIAAPTAKQPFCGLKNVRFFVLIEFALQRQMSRDQTSCLVSVNRRGPRACSNFIATTANVCRPEAFCATLVIRFDRQCPGSTLQRRSGRCRIVHFETRKQTFRSRRACRAGYIAPRTCYRGMY